MHLSPLSSGVAGDKNQPELLKPSISLRPSLQSLWLGKRFYVSDPGIGIGRI